MNRPVITLSLFGTTTGLEVLHLPLSNSALPFRLEDSWIEVSPSHLIIKPGKESFVILRRFVGSQTLTWIGLYRTAKEIGYDRQGSFYGAGVWLIDHVVDVKLAIDVLRLMADQIQAKAMNGDSFVKRLADVRGDINLPNQLAQLADNPVKINSGCHPSGETAFIAGGANPVEVIDWAQRAASAKFLARIFIGWQDQSPDTGGRVSTQVFRSLASAIDSTFNRTISELHRKVSERDQEINELKKQNAGFNDEYSNARLQLEGVRQELNSTKQQLHDSNESHRREFVRAEQLQAQIKTILESKNLTAQPAQQPAQQPAHKTKQIVATKTTSDLPSDSSSIQDKTSGQDPQGGQNKRSHLTKDPLKDLVAVPINPKPSNLSFILLLVALLMVIAAFAFVVSSKKPVPSPTSNENTEHPGDPSPDADHGEPPKNDFPSSGSLPQNAKVKAEVKPADRR